MDELISLLPALIIFFFIFKRISGIFEKIAEKSEEMSGEEIIYEEPESFEEELIYDEQELAVNKKANKAKEIKDTNIEEEVLESDNIKADKVQAEKKSYRFNKKASKEIAAKKEKRRTRTKNTIFPGNKLQQEDIVRGFVFKQILDEPRAKKPWKADNKR